MIPPQMLEEMYLKEPECQLMRTPSLLKLTWDWEKEPKMRTNQKSHGSELRDSSWELNRVRKHSIPIKKKPVVKESLEKLPKERSSSE